MRSIPLRIVILYLMVSLNFCDVGNYQGEQNHPSIFLVREQAENFKKDIRKAEYINKLISDREKDFKVLYIDPTSDVECRDPVHLKHAIVSSEMSGLVRGRLSRPAFLCLYTGENRNKELVIRHNDALYDSVIWPM